MKHLYLILFVAGLSACTTVRPRRLAPTPAPAADAYVTPYRPVTSYGSNWGGYMNTPDSNGDGIEVVSFLGTYATPESTARDSALYRAAETALNSGHRYFTIIDERRFNWSSSYSINYAIRCHNDFRPSAVDAAQLMNVIGTSYQS